MWKPLHSLEMTKSTSRGWNLQRSPKLQMPVQGKYWHILSLYNLRYVRIGSWTTYLLLCFSVSRDLNLQPMGAALSRKVDLMEAKSSWWTEHLRGFLVVVAVAEVGDGVAGEEAEVTVKTVKLKSVLISWFWGSFLVSSVYLGGRSGNWVWTELNMILACWINVNLLKLSYKC